MIYETITKCRACGCDSNQLVNVLTFAPQYLGSIFTHDNSTDPLAKEKVPLTLTLCRQCSSIQLQDTVKPEYLYTTYYYRSATNRTTRENLKDVAQACLARVAGYKTGDLVLDIGSNDGTLLRFFPGDLRRIGIEPAKNVYWHDHHNAGDLEVINDYFSLSTVKALVGEQKARVITCCACYYDMPDPSQTARDIAALLANDGVCVIQVSHLLATVRDYNYYDICHEHLFYYSLQTLQNVLSANGLTIFDCETNDINGGTIRVYAGHPGQFERQSSYWRVKSLEEEYKLASPTTYSKFGARICEDVVKIYDFVAAAKERGKRVLGLGASTKGNVLLQLCDLDNSLIQAISDRNPLKVGMRTLGTDIPVISEDEARRLKPDYFFCPIWNFKHEIVEREAKYLAAGGKILFAMPYPYILDKEGEHKL